MRSRQTSAQRPGLDSVLPLVALLLVVAVMMQAMWNVEMKLREAAQKLDRAKTDITQLAKERNLPDPFPNPDANLKETNPKYTVPPRHSGALGGDAMATAEQASAADEKAKERAIELLDEQHPVGDDASSGTEHFELTPVPPVVRNVTANQRTIAPSTAVWPETDPNYGFTTDVSLPLIAVVTLNAQQGKNDRIRTTHNKASMIHAMSFHNKIEYCRKWGYDLIVEDNEIVDKTRDVAWSKIPIWKKWLSKYQWLMWMDMDAFFMRFDLDLTRFLDDRYDVVIAKDFNGINMGVMFVRNSPKTFEILQRMWDAPRAWWYPWEEQSALMAMLDPRKNTRDAAQLQRHFLHPPQRDFNSYPGDFSYGNAMSMYKDGDFIAHFPNCKAFGHCQQTISRFYRRSCDQNDVKEMAADPPPRYYPGDKFDIYDASRFE